MSILIKKLKIPKDDFIDVRIFSGGVAVRVTKEEPCMREYETVEVPKPHGDLIDRDSLIRARYSKEFYGNNLASLEWDNKCIYSAPTVIEAENGEDS